MRITAAIREQLLCAVLASCSAGEGTSSVTARAHPVPFRIDYDARAYAFLGRYLGNRSIVQLGESIHVTDEFPQARLHLVRYLHEELGFDVLAFEGSLLASWLAQDQLYRSKDPLQAKIRRAQELAWFGLWQTSSMLRVMEYAARTQSTDSPLYLASFDIQPGTSRAFSGSGAAALDAFLDALAVYQAPRDQNARARWRDAITPFFNCYRSAKPYTQSEQTAALDAIAALDGWIVEAAPGISRATSEMHAAAVRQIPESLRSSVQLCDEASRSGLRIYQETRDRLNATHALALRDSVSRAHRVVLWAHHSHVNHNSTGKNVPSMGQHLLRLAAKDLYTIGLFAGRGRALEVSDDGFPPVVPRQIRPASDYGLEGLFAKVRGSDFFIDFFSMNASTDEMWFREVSTRMETRWKTVVVPARDFHAALFVDEVHPAGLSMLPSAIAAALTVYGFILDHLFAVIVALILSVALVVQRWRRRRRRRLAAT